MFSRQPPPPPHLIPPVYGCTPHDPIIGRCFLSRRSQLFYVGKIAGQSVVAAVNCRCSSLIGYVATTFHLCLCRHLRVCDAVTGATPTTFLSSPSSVRRVRFHSRLKLCRRRQRRL
ncbi:unnamed protein product [Lactuca virosa]|uniref:Uncharacterized protein n=1 Tax=Lactuca virosa TaxID=75947 RepID=A0AAU9MN94_9ASTR|nr:unnamed protein product [Lactuca virosa]